MLTIYLEGLNALLTAYLLSVYIPNYRVLKSGVGLGLCVFAGLLLLQNAAGLFLHFTSGEIYVKMLATQVFVLKLIETCALIVLSYTAWKE